VWDRSKNGLKIIINGFGVLGERTKTDPDEVAEYLMN